MTGGRGALPARVWPAGRLAEWARRGIDALVPAACVSCRRGVPPRGVPLCALCRGRAPALPHPRCPRCAEPVGTRPRGAPFELCGTCERWPDAIAAADAAFAFEGVAAFVVRSLKYDGWRALAPWMVERMERPARRALARAGAETPPMVVPVPLARARLRERGFNQAEALATPLAARCGWTVAERLIRAPGGRKQARSLGVARRENVQGRFRVAPGQEGVGPVLLVDDVLTTGATAFACGAALAKAGFGPISVVTFARTLRPLDASASGPRP